MATNGMRGIGGKAILRWSVVDGRRRRCRRNAKPGRANIQVVGVGISVGASTANAALVDCNENGGG